jgi:hypothetical protein
MDAKQKRGVLFISAFIALALLLRWLSGRTPEVLASPPQSDFSDPLLWPIPGVYPDAQGFQSVVNVDVNVPMYGGGDQYVPTFGLIGMVGVKAL